MTANTIQIILLVVATALFLLQAWVVRASVSSMLGWIGMAFFSLAFLVPLTVK